MLEAHRKFGPLVLRFVLFMERGRSGATRLAGQARRYWLTHFQPDYVQAQLARREGECRRCGKCCTLVFDCPFLKEGGCAIYGRAGDCLRPKSCKIFPIDRRDLKDVRLCGGSCGFGFKS